MNTVIHIFFWSGSWYSEESSSSWHSETMVTRNKEPIQSCAMGSQPSGGSLYFTNSMTLRNITNQIRRICVNHEEAPYISSSLSKKTNCTGLEREAPYISSCISNCTGLEREAPYISSCISNCTGRSLSKKTNCTGLLCKGELHICTGLFWRIVQGSFAKENYTFSFAQHNYSSYYGVAMISRLL